MDLKAAQSKFAEAEDERVKGNAEKAIPLYTAVIEAAQSGSELHLDASHMLGVCLSATDRYQVAEATFIHLLEDHPLSDLRRARILRDYADVLRKLGDLEKALDFAKNSFQMVWNLEADPADQGASLGLIARIELELGNNGLALVVGEAAAGMFQEDINRHLETVHRVWLTVAYALGGYAADARRMADQYLPLAREFAKPVHEARLQAVIELADDREALKERLRELTSD